MRLLIKFFIAFISKFKLVILFSTLFGLFLYLFIIFVLPKITIYRTKTIGYVGRYTINTLPFEIASQISSGLVKIDDTSEVHPSIADRWEMEDDGKKWIFYISNNVFWQNNKKFLVEDINYNFNNVSVIKNRDNIIFTLNEPYVPFIYLLEKPIFKKGLLGTGEWKVDKLSVRGEYIQKIVLVHDKEKQVIKFYPTEEQAKFAYKMGEINILKNQSSPKPFESWNNTSIENIVNYDQIVTIFFNTTDPVLSDKNIRQALNYAIEKKYSDPRAYSPISPKSYYYNSQVKRYDFDLERAKKLINDSTIKIPQDYTIKLLSNPNLINIAEDITKNWTALGIKSTVLVSSNIPSDYQAFITIFNSPKDPDQYSLWHSTQSETNITNYKNLRIDKLLEDGRVDENKEERKGIYLDFQRYLVEDSPAIFLFHPSWYDIIRK